MIVKMETNIAEAPMFRCKSCHKMDRRNYDIGKGRYDTQTVR